MKLSRLTRLKHRIQDSKGLKMFFPVFWGVLSALLAYELVMRSI